MSNIPQQRLYHQQLSHPTLRDAVEVVGWLGAIQSQDYGAAKWAVGQRAIGLTDADIDQALADGTILRTHVMRPTWHFVTPADIRWMLALTAPRIHALNATYYRKLELNDAIFARSIKTLVKALEGGQQMTRSELSAVLEQTGIPMGKDDLLRFTYLIGYAELEGIVCSGARRGKQFTYALLDERVPATRKLARDEALAELTRRYFTSHGPATLQDFVWWSGLTMTDARAGLDRVKSQLVEQREDDLSYWLSPSQIPAAETAPTTYLLPNFDEYVVGYTDRSAIYTPSPSHPLDARGNFLFNHTIVINGQVVGTWKRTLKKREVVIEPTVFRPLTPVETDSFTAATQRYGAFLRLEAVVV